MTDLVDEVTRPAAGATGRARGNNRLSVVRGSTAANRTTPFDPPSDDRIEQALARRADPNGFCVTAVCGSTADEVLRAFGADPTVQPLARHARRDGPAGLSLIRLAGGVVVIEDGGVTGSDPEVLRAASARGRAASYHCSGAGVEVLGFAEFGKLLESGRCALPAERLRHPALDALVDEVAAASGGNHLLLPVLVLERFVGMVIDEPAMPGPIVAHRVPDPSA